MMLSKSSAHSVKKKNLLSNTSVNVADRYNLIYWISLLLGCGTLFAYNFIVSAQDYFRKTFNDDSIMFTIQAVEIIPNIIITSFMIFVGNLSSFKLQIMPSFIIIGVSIICLPLLLDIKQLSDIYTIKWITFSIAGITGITTAILQIAITGFCNHLPIKYLQISISGQSFAGIIAGSFRLIFKQNTKTENIIYFCIGGGFNIFCSILFLFITKTLFIKFYLNQQNHDNFVDDSYHDKVERGILSQQSQHHKISSLLRSHTMDETKNDDEKNNKFEITATSTSINAVNNQHNIANYKTVWMKLRKLAFSLCLVWFVTFLIFPGLIVSLINKPLIFGTYLVLEFNICDYIGRRYFALWTTCTFTKNNLWIACIWRIIIYPIFILMYLNIINPNKYVAIGFTAILGVTHGHFCCLCFIWASQVVQLHEQRVCGAIMNWALLIGITLGTYTAFGIQYLINHVK